MVIFAFRLSEKKKVYVWTERPHGCSVKFRGRSGTFVVVPWVLSPIIHVVRGWYG